MVWNRVAGVFLRGKRCNKTWFPFVECWSIYPSKHFEVICCILFMFFLHKLTHSWLSECKWLANLAHCTAVFPFSISGFVCLIDSKLYCILLERLFILLLLSMCPCFSQKRNDPDRWNFRDFYRPTFSIVFKWTKEFSFRLNYISWHKYSCINMLTVKSQTLKQLHLKKKKNLCLFVLGCWVGGGVEWSLSPAATLLFFWRYYPRVVSVLFCKILNATQVFWDKSQYLTDFKYSDHRS